MHCRSWAHQRPHAHEDTARAPPMWPRRTAVTSVVLDPGAPCVTATHPRNVAAHAAASLTSNAATKKLGREKSNGLGFWLGTSFVSAPRDEDRWSVMSGADRIRPRWFGLWATSLCGMRAWIRWARPNATYYGWLRFFRPTTKLSLFNDFIFKLLFQLIVNWNFKIIM
jgi:hypothetical protein